MKIAGIITETNGRETERLLGKELIHVDIEGINSYNILKEFIDKDVLNEPDRWFDVEKDQQGHLYATSGTVDLEYYIEIKL